MTAPGPHEPTFLGEDWFEGFMIQNRVHARLSCLIVSD